MFRRLTISIFLLLALLSAMIFQQQQGLEAVKEDSEKKITSIEKPSSQRPLLQTNILPESGLRPVRMLFFGDLMLGRYVRTIIDKNGAESLFQKIRQEKSYFDGYADLIIANLEGPIVSNPIYHSSGTTFGFHSSSASIIKKSGIQLVSLANNHTLDRGQKGLEETKKYLTDAGVEFFGDPILPEDKDVLVKNIRGETFAFVGLHDATRKLDEKSAAEIIKKYDQKVDHVIVFIHWGIEYRDHPSERQQTLARLFIDHGADLIIGHHPHWVQTHEKYRSVDIFYSLGNFIFDQYWSDKTQHGLAVEIEWGKSGTIPTELPLTLYKSVPAWKIEKTILNPKS